MGVGQEYPVAPRICGTGCARLLIKAGDDHLGTSAPLGKIVDHLETSVLGDAEVTRILRRSYLHYGCR